MTKTAQSILLCFLGLFFVVAGLVTILPDVMISDSGTAGAIHATYVALCVSGGVFLLGIGVIIMGIVTWFR